MSRILWIPLAATSNPQILVPISDISTGSWVPSSGVDLYATLDESIASDVDYITTSSISTCEVKLSTGIDPNSSIEHTLNYRLLSGTGSVSVHLYQGASLIVSYGPHTLTGSAQDFSQTLSAAEADSITDYSDIRVRFISS